ncbi:Gfo/Idh/MocA family oxidoreductase [Nocardioides sp.]|jgi:predicted dehydrogenase|uniref:Gfo/Idh/MocA family protein n=1 Tax=Nocardioides sp. TaxID=35761 RepID=UPI002F3FBCE2
MNSAQGGTETTGRLRVGVAGIGYWGSKHVRTMRSLDSVSQVVVIDPSEERVAKLRHSFPEVDSYPDLESALPAIDALVVATPPSTHAPLACAAMEAGKHVLVEKPFATELRDAHRMVRTAGEGGVVLMVGHTFEYHSAVWALREMVARGDLGDLYYLDTSRLNLGLYQQDVNVLFDLAPHDISILNYVLGSTPTSVECWGSRHAHRRLEDIAYLRVCYDEPHVEANVHVSWLDPCKVRRMTVVGSSKMVVFDDLEGEERIRVHNKGVSERDDSADLTMPPMSYRYGEVVAPYLAFNEPLLLEDEHFVDCVLTGMRPLTDGANGLAVVEVLEAAQLSMKEHREVFIEEVRRSLRVDDEGLLGTAALVRREAV